MSGFVVNNLLFTKTEKAIIIRRTDRQELPHLSIFFATSSGEIDGHLKYELAPAGTDPYTPLFKFPATELSKLEANGSRVFDRELQNTFSTLKKATPPSLPPHTI